MNTNTSTGWWSQIPPVTRNIILINVLVWVVEMIAPRFGNTIINTLGLHFWGGSKFNPIQLATYLFIHSNTTALHVLFNMFTLYMFGRAMEHVWGSRRFLIYYFVCGIGAGILQEVVWQITWHHEFISSLAHLNGTGYHTMDAYISSGIASGDMECIDSIRAMKNSLMCVGASGAIFGILLGFAFVFPNIPMYLFFIPVPIKAKYMVGAYAVLEFFLGIAGTGTTVAHFAHLGGMLFGLILLLIWRHNGTLRGRMF